MKFSLKISVTQSLTSYSEKFHSASATITSRFRNVPYAYTALGKKKLKLIITHSSRSIRSKRVLHRNAPQPPAVEKKGKNMQFFLYQAKIISIPTLLSEGGEAPRQQAPLVKFIKKPVTFSCFQVFSFFLSYEK